MNGDGAADYSSNNPTHSYPENTATYSVTLTVSNSAGSDSATQSISVTQPLKAQSQLLSTNAVAPPREQGSDRSGSGDSGSGARQSDSLSRSRPRPRVSTCLSLPANIQVSNFTRSTQCRQVGPSGIGKADVLAQGFVDAVDVYGWVRPNTQVCFLSYGGSLRFLDAATAPRTVSQLPAFGHEGLVCANIKGAGTVVLLLGPPPSPPSPTPLPSQSLSGCMVTTTAMLNFRAGPAGEVIGALPYNVTLTALERTPDWFKVDYHGDRGWISANYVTTQGICG